MKLFKRKRIINEAIDYIEEMLFYESSNRIYLKHEFTSTDFIKLLNILKKGE